jgi:hypothetical protein
MKEEMLKVSHLLKTIMISGCFALHSYAESDSEKLQNAVFKITSKDFHDISSQDYANAWDDLCSLVESSVGFDEVKEIISITMERYKDQWQKLGEYKKPWECLWNISQHPKFDVLCSRNGVINLAACCLSKGFYFSEFIELLRVIQGCISAEQCSYHICRLIEAEHSLQELENLACQLIDDENVDKTDLSLEIYRCFAENKIFKKEALLAVKKTVSRCRSGVLATGDVHYLMETTLRILITLVKQGDFLDDAFEVTKSIFIGFDGIPMDQFSDLLLNLLDYNSHRQKIFELMWQFRSSNYNRIRECVLTIYSYDVLTNGQQLDVAYKLAAQGLNDVDDDVRCEAVNLFASLLYNDFQINDVMSAVHLAEIDENSSVTDGAHHLRYLLVAKGYLIEESFDLIKNKKIDVDFTLELYQALVFSGHYMDEAFENVKCIIRQNKGDTPGILALLTLLLLHNYKFNEVKQCGMSYIENIKESISFEDDFSHLAWLYFFMKGQHDLGVQYRINSECDDNFDDNCKLMFIGLFTAPDLFSLKKWCKEKFKNQSINPEILINLLFLEKPASKNSQIQSLRGFASRKWKSYGCDGMKMHRWLNSECLLN